MKKKDEPVNIYKATHKKSGKIYVGQTQYKIEFRMGQHWSSFGSNTTFHTFLHSTKMDEWTWEIIEVVENKEQAFDCEMYYINLWNLYEEGLNSKPGYFATEEGKKFASKQMKKYKAENPDPWNKGRTQVYSEKTLDLMRLAKLRNPTRLIYTEEDKKRKSLEATNSVNVLELTTGKEFNSISAAARFFNLKRESVRDVVNGKRSHTKGLIFKKIV